jgi:hypothetical protein
MIYKTIFWKGIKHKWSLWKCFRYVIKMTFYKCYDYVMKKEWKNEEWQEWRKERMNECMNVVRYLMAYEWMNDGTNTSAEAAILYGPPGMAYLSAL